MATCIFSTLLCDRCIFSGSLQDTARAPLPLLRCPLDNFNRGPLLHAMGAWNLPEHSVSSALHGKQPEPAEGCLECF